LISNFDIIGFPFSGRIPVDLSHFSLHFDSIFLILAYGPTGGGGRYKTQVGILQVGNFAGWNFAGWGFCRLIMQT
jgi:hypothetical protein